MREDLSSAEIDLAARGIDDLSDAELRRWMVTCLRMAQSGTISWFSRRRWRREHRDAFSALTRRAIERMGPGPGRCERCHSVPPTQHLVYGEGAAERYGHFCRECSRFEPSGWLGVVTTPRKP